MLTYQDLYQQGISYFDRDVEQLIAELTNNSHITLASLPGMGEKRFLEYFVYQLEQAHVRIPGNKETNTIYFPDNQIDFDQVEAQISKDKRNLLILLHPNVGPDQHFSKRDSAEADSQQRLRILVDKYDITNLQIIANVGIDVFIHPENYTELPSLVANIFSRKPLNASETYQNIEHRRQLHGWQILKKFDSEIYEMSGGITRLIKRISRIVSEMGEVDRHEILNAPAVQVVLSLFQDPYELLTDRQLRNLGLIDKQGEVRSQILKKYFENKRIPKRVKLPKKLRELFNLLYLNRGHIVTNEDIDEALRGKFDSSLWGNYKLISRLRDALTGRYKITSVKGKGYVLEEL